VIRTPDQRLRVFVSSTLAELAPEREAVERAVKALALTPVMFELGARPYAPRELYRAYLAQSDIFVGLYWERYGWVGPDMDISGLEDEFRLSGGLPRLLYVKAPAPEREAGLARMLDEIKEKGTEAYRTFTTTRELGRLVRDDLAILLSERFAAGASAGAQPAGSDAMVSATVPRRPRSIPVTSTSLIGRDEQIDEVVALIQAPGTRLVTLVGPGGVGKTRLAIAVAERLDADFPQGATYLALGSISRSDLVMPRIASAVGASIEGARTPMDAVAEFLAETPTLLVLDELEQVAGIAPELDALLARCPGLRILATSRTILRIRAEREYPVAPLSVPAFADRPAVADVADLPAVRLFVDRAQAARFGFTLTDDDAPAIAAICQRLDGLPLAIELAAARTRLLDPSSLLERLRGSLDALGVGPVDLPERQRTLRATVGWSFGLLDADELRMIESLSVFADGWTLDAAAAVTEVSEDRTLDLLDALAGNSLVTVDAVEGGPRFRMATTVRELAAERLAEREDHAAIEQRHAAWFRSLVEGTDWPAERQAVWTTRIGREEANIAAAVRWSLDHDITPLPHLFRILWLYWQSRDRMPEGYAWIQESLGRAGELDEPGQAELQFVAAITAVEVGDDERALTAAAALERLRPRVDEPYLRAATDLAMSWILPIREDIEGALRAAIAAEDGFRAQGQPFLGWAALTVGLLEMTLGRLDEARVSLTEAAELGRRYENRWLETAANTQLAVVAVRTGHHDEARRLLATVADPSAAVDLSTQGLTFALVAHARLVLADGDPSAAALAMGAAEGQRRRAGTPAWPSRRRAEQELNAEIAAQLEPGTLADTMAAGARLNRAQSIALIREGMPG
jgi:predicted ATPase